MNTYGRITFRAPEVVGKSSVHFQHHSVPFDMEQANSNIECINLFIAVAVVVVFVVRPSLVAQRHASLCAQCSSSPVLGRQTM